MIGGKVSGIEGVTLHQMFVGSETEPCLSIFIHVHYSLDLDQIKVNKST